MAMLNSPGGPSQGQSYGPSQLAGDSQGQGPQPGSDPQSQSQALQAVVQQVRSAEQTIMGLAQQFPQAAPEARRAGDAIRAVLQRIVSSPSNTDQPVPQSLA